MARIMARKTVDVKALVESFNTVFAQSTCDKLIRKGQIIVIENILMTTNNYKGFRYLLQNEVPAGELPGVRHDVRGILPPDMRFENTDDTRVMYFV